MVNGLVADRLVDRVENSLQAVLSYAEKHDYAGYSKFDVFNSPFMRLLALNNRYLRLVFTTLWARSPVDLRPFLGMKRSRNPKGIALFTLAYLRRYRRQGEQRDLSRARNLLSWLNRTSIPHYSGQCWGYDHDWQSVYFYAPRNSPNLVVTGNVVYAFLEAYEVTGDQLYLDIARSSVEFILNDLVAPIQIPEMRSISYVPGCQWGALNINGLAATILAWVWQHTGEPQLLKEAQQLMAFLVDKQTDYGAWHYGWPAERISARHDNYHTGNVLDWVLDYSRRSGDDRFLLNYQQGLTFYRDHLFLSDGAPRWMSGKDYPLDVHSAAQGIVTFAKASMDFDRRYIEDSRRVAKWAIENMQAGEGYFYYQQGRFWKKKYTLMRWCNAWMAYALSSLLLAEQRLPGGPV